MQKHGVILLLSVLSFLAQAQAQDGSETEISEPAPATDITAPNEAARKAPSGEATISLQTTVTGNQEQPRVLYILPWQSPLSGDIEFQTLSNQQDEVFGHIEREELRRTLEAEAVLDKTKP